MSSFKIDYISFIFDETNNTFTNINNITILPGFVNSAEMLNFKNELIFFLKNNNIQNEDEPLLKKQKINSSLLDFLFLLIINHNSKKNDIKIPTNDIINNIYDLLNIFNKHVDNVNLLINNQEDYLFFLNFYYYFNIFSKSKFIFPVFNLPAGFGKTYLSTLFFDKNFKNKNKIKILCPTAKAASLYNDAKTIHSSIKINNDWRFERTTFNRFVQDLDIILIDEYSMVPENFIIDLFHSIIYYNVENKKNIFLFLTGDSAQLKPIKIKNFLSLLSKNLKHPTNYSELKIITCNTTIELYRFRNSLLLNNVILIIKKMIDDLYYSRNINTDNNNKYIIKYKKEGLNIFFDFFKKFNVSSIKIDMKTIVNKIFKNFEYNINLLKDNDQYENVIFKELPICVAFENKYTNEIQEKVYQEFYYSNKTSLEFIVTHVESNNNYYDIDIFQESIPNIFIKKSDYEFNRNLYLKYLQNLPGNVGLVDNKIKIGSVIICKKNLNEKIINGTCGILLGLKINSNLNIKKEIVKINISSINFKKNKDTFKTYRIYLYDDDELPEDFCFWEFYDFKLKKSYLIPPHFCTSICSSCFDYSCKHRTEKINLCGFFFQTFFSSTLYNLQGVTINNESKIIFDNDMLLPKNNKLRPLYVLLSRIENYNNLECDIFFIKDCLKILFDNNHKKEIDNYILNFF